MARDLVERTPHKRLTKKQLKQLASFTDPGTVLAALAKENWTIEESIQHLVDIAKGAESGIKTSTQLNAIKYLNQLIIDAMERSGLMVMATKKFVGEGGEEVRFSGHVVSSVLKEQKEQTTPADLLNSAVKENNNGQRNNKDKNGKSKSSESSKDSKESQDDLHTTKAPEGQEIAAGHFNGISREGYGHITGSNSGDFL